MKKIKTHNKYKIKKKYRLSFQSENTLNEIWSFKLSKFKVILTSVIIFIALISLISWIIIGTPLKTLLPGYLKSEERNQYIRTAISLDSLEQRIETNAQFISSIKNILTDNIKENPKVVKADSTKQQIITDSLIDQSETETEFIKQYNEERKFSLSILAPLSAEGIVFSKPIENSISVDNQNNILSLKTLDSAPISAVYDGSIINISPDSDYTKTIIIQHPNGFLSVYHNLGTTYVNAGDKVNAAQRIATTYKDANSRPFKFELWHEGKIVNPQEYILF